ncbi:C-type lectin domain family 4 member K [Merluccius polli]|uniref:C-type lectin domain family 4 member K n=1 Tax=Merluccius polli TaxID=89951 RepID=A0AA47NYM3_MERPO|nr:C-type lectin domain family 4 member K [Merluccius polli]
MVMSPHLINADPLAQHRITVDQGTSWRCRLCISVVPNKGIETETMARIDLEAKLYFTHLILLPWCLSAARIIMGCHRRPWTVLPDQGCVPAAAHEPGVLNQVYQDVVASPDRVGLTAGLTDSGEAVQRGTMASIHELDSGLPEEQENLSLDVRATRKRRSDDLILLGWMYYNHSVYYSSTTGKNWTASRDYCLERDADLVVINSREEQEFVGGLGFGHWIGLSKRDPEGTWKWVDGTNMTSSFWGRGQPDNNRGAEDCVATQGGRGLEELGLGLRTGLGGSWHDGPCAELVPWICEKFLVLDHLQADLNKEVMREGEAPQIYDPPSSKTVSVGETANFSCCARGRPQPTIQWLQDGRLLETNGTDNRSESVVRMDGENLVLRGVRSGVETVLCMATNSAGTANHTAWLPVYGKTWTQGEMTSVGNNGVRVFLSHSTDRRPDGWLHYNHSLYFISTTEKNWAASRDDCLERDADLIVINSREEQLCCHDNRYHYYLKQEFVEGLGGFGHWIGLNKRDPEGTWKWVDGTNMTSSFWRRGQPDNNRGAEDCVATLERNDPLIIQVGGPLERGWYDKPCAVEYYWICEKV